MAKEKPRPTGTVPVVPMIPSAMIAPGVRAWMEAAAGFVPAGYVPAPVDPAEDALAVVYGMSPELREFCETVATELLGTASARMAEFFGHAEPENAGTPEDTADTSPDRLRIEIEATVEATKASLAIGLLLWSEITAVIGEAAEGMNADPVVLSRSLSLLPFGYEIIRGRQTEAEKVARN